MSRAAIRIRAVIFAIVSAASWRGAAFALPPCPTKLTSPDAAKVPIESSIREARLRFERGIQLYGDGDYKLALIEFSRAYELAPSYRILYNIGQVHSQLASYSQALEYLDAYLKFGGQQIPIDRRESVERDIGILKTRIAHLSVFTNVSRADVLVDDLSVARTPMACAVVVDAGTHKVVLTKDHFFPSSRVVTLAGGDSANVTLDLSPVGQAPSDRERPWLWVGWGATATLAVAATGAGLATLSAKKEFGALSEPGSRERTSEEAWNEKQARVKTWALATDLFAGAALVSAGLSLYFTLKPTNSTEALVKVTATPSSAALSGAF